MVKPHTLLILYALAFTCSWTSLFGQKDSSEKALSTEAIENEESYKVLEKEPKHSANNLGEMLLPEEKAKDFIISSSDVNFSELVDITELIDDGLIQDPEARDTKSSTASTLQTLARGVQAAVLVFSAIAIYRLLKMVRYTCSNIYTRRHRGLVSLLGGAPTSEHGISAAYLRAKLKAIGFFGTLAIILTAAGTIYWIGVSHGL